MAWHRLGLLLLLIPLFVWSHARLPHIAGQPPAPEMTRDWDQRSELLQGVLAGPIPGFWADAAVLNLFNVFDVARHTTGELRHRWWRELAYLLHEALSLDPRFRDGLRLTEGLLGYEPGFTAEAVDLLEQCGPNVSSGEYLLVASFLAHVELNQTERALRLADMAADKPDVGSLAQGFAAKLLLEQHGCQAALAFLEYRKSKLPLVYADQLQARIERMRKDPECRQDVPPANAPPEIDLPKTNAWETGKAS
ncbi:MAG: hypothetical protein D6703_01160 [Zetaproteobacteria bacterium]|nr:MAG: hypothetical protein D6703_01160 [Zetaproteobacteria bacterium]